MRPNSQSTASLTQQRHEVRVKLLGQMQSRIGCRSTVFRAAGVNAAADSKPNQITAAHPNHVVGLWMLQFIFALLFAFDLAAAPLGNTVTIAFEEANRLYEQGNYDEAISSYLKILGGGVESPAIYFNLGNAYFKSGQLGRAIHSYIKAHRLAPRDPDIWANLQFVRAAVAGGSAPAQPFLERMITRLNLDEWTILAAGCLWLLCVTQALRQLVSWVFLEKRSLTIVLSVMLALTSVGLANAWYLSYQQRAIVVKPDTILHHGPLSESPTLQVLQDGQELVVLDRKDEWLQVSGASRGVGWVNTNDVVLLP